MKALLLGATGGCGSQVLVRLLDRGVATTVIIRDERRLPNIAKGHALLTVVVEKQGHLHLSEDELRDYVRCDAVVSCVGHNMTRKGIWGHPRKLCSDTTQRICDAIRSLAPAEPIKYIVISTEGVDRLDGSDPPRGCVEHLVLWLLKHLLPPHADNMATVAYLHKHVSGGGNPHVAFCAVRPSDLKDDDASEFTLHATLQNGIFNAGSTRRANVGEFMADLVTKPAVWAEWKNSYPQILDVVVPDPTKAKPKAR